MPDLTLLTPVEKLQGVGPAVARGLRELGLFRVGHLIAHVPHRYQRIEPETTLDNLPHDHVVSARGEVTASRLAGNRRNARFEIVLEDGHGRLDVVWFNAAYLQRKIKPGHWLRVRGTTRLYNRALQLANPEYEILENAEAEPAIDEPALRPVYPASEHIASRVIERVIARSLDRILPLIDDHLPEPFLAERSMPTLCEAYRRVHAPKDEDEAAGARRRLAYDELLLLQLGVFMRRAQLELAKRAPALAIDDALDTRIRARMPFTLTDAQNHVVGEIAGDLATDRPTNRLIQGDVGSGKTVVALYAMLMAVAAGHQGAIMAPTEILAEQHFLTIKSMLADSRTKIELLTGATPKAERDALLSRLEAGAIDILIGTHALLSEGVRFKSLAVAVIDEQHRFGVHQRAALRAKADDPKSTPHVLVMTATPIPRTLALTAFGDLDISTIDALPPGRTPIKTRLFAPQQRSEAYALVRERLEQGQQAFLVAPVIEQSETGIMDVRTLLRDLEAGPLAGFRLALMHGQLSQRERETVMERFRAADLDALIATSVIEVGVDLPNASVMCIENAERFGLAQLHQLRGRVGRGDHASLCLLIADPTTEDATERLVVMEATADGFEIAQRDLEIRGPGEFFGAAQSGMPRLRVADLARDLDLLTLARKDARAWIEASPELARPEEESLRRRMFKAVGKELGLVEIG